MMWLVMVELQQQLFSLAYFRQFAKKGAKNVATCSNPISVKFGIEKATKY